MTDFLIIGQGLAGTTLAHTIEAKGYTYHIVDQIGHDSSTKVAAGLINPITGRRYVKSWMVDTFIPTAEEFYTGLEDQLKSAFYSKFPIRKILANDEIIHFFEEKMKEEDMKAWKDNSPFSKPDSILYAARNIGSIQGARLDTNAYLLASLKHFQAKESFIEKSISYDDLKLENGTIEFNGNSYKNCVFCEGYQLKENPFFNYLPLNLCKGEVLTLESDHGLNGCYQKNNFVLPIDENHLKVGSNYEWKDLTMNTTEETKNMLLEKMGSMMNLDYKVVMHKAGIRPTVKDRRPFLGSHSDHQNLYVFNGLGTKGVSLAPYFANHLVDHIVDGRELMSEVNITRFDK